MVSEGAFIEPPPFGVVGDYSDLNSYGINSTVKLEWTLPTNETVANIWLIQDNVPSATCKVLNWADTTCALLLTGSRGKSWDWPLNEPDQYSVTSPIYWLSMLDADDDSRLFGSHYFNVLPQSLIVSSSTTIATSITSTQRSSTATSISGTQGPSVSASATTTPSASASPQSQSTNSSNSGSTTKIAMGVAVGIGVPLIAALVAIAYFLYRSHKRKENTKHAQDDAEQIHHIFEKKSFAAAPQYTSATHSVYDHDLRKPAELPGSGHCRTSHGVPVELDTRS